MYDQIFFSPRVKRSEIIIDKHGIYELTHKLSNDLRLGILRNKKISGKSLNFTELYSGAQSSFHYENFVNTSKKLLKDGN